MPRDSKESNQTKPMNSKIQLFIGSRRRFRPCNVTYEVRPALERGPQDGNYRITSCTDAHTLELYAVDGDGGVHGTNSSREVDRSIMEANEPMKEFVKKELKRSIQSCLKEGDIKVVVKPLAKDMPLDSMPELF